MKAMSKCAPMGWNSYDYYDTSVTEADVRANADYMANHLKEYGWEYIVVDIQWYAKKTGSMREKYQYIPFGGIEMDEFGRLWPDPEKFPSAVRKDGAAGGFGPLAEYVHSLGLKFGIHMMRGIPREAAHRHLKIRGSGALASEIADPHSICAWNPDMYGIRKDTDGAQEYYDSVIQLYADWGVDYIKCDDICTTNMNLLNPYSAAHEVEMIAKAIEKCGRPVLFSLSPGPAVVSRASHYGRYANMWRITDDFWDRWDHLYQMFYQCEKWQNYVEEGSYPDCDMLPVGTIGKGFGQERTTGFTWEEQKTMMTLWCMFGSPLMIGAELTKLDSRTTALLTNREVLKLVSNDYVGRQAELEQDYAVWSCLNKKTGEKYIALFNLAEEERQIGISSGQIRQFDGQIATETGTAYELWSGESFPIENGYVGAKIPEHGVKIFQIK